MIDDRSDVQFTKIAVWLSLNRFILIPRTTAMAIDLNLTIMYLELYGFHLNGGYNGYAFKMFINSL